MRDCSLSMRSCLNAFTGWTVYKFCFNWWHGGILSWEDELQTRRTSFLWGLFSVSSRLNPFLLRLKQNMTGSLKLLIVFLNHASSGWHMQKDANVLNNKEMVCVEYSSLFLLHRVSLPKKLINFKMWEIYIMFYKRSKCSLRQPQITPPSPKRFVLRSLDRMATNGYYFFPNLIALEYVTCVNLRYTCR